MIGSSATSPTSTSAQPPRITAAGRRLPDRRPAISADANIVSDSGAIVRPVCSALYSSTICR